MTQTENTDAPTPVTTKVDPEQASPSPGTRLAKLSSGKVSLQTVSRGSARLLGRALARLGQPVTRRYVLPGTANPAIAEAKARTASLPRGTHALLRTDGKVLLAGQRNQLLQQAVRDGLDLTGVYLARRNLSGMTLGAAEMDRADLRLAKLHETSLFQTKLGKADLRRARLTDVRGSGVKADGADFSQALLAKSNFRHAELAGASFVSATLRSTNLQEATLPEADFTKATLKDVSLKSAVITAARFDGATLRGGDYFSADLRDVDFTATKFARHRYLNSFGDFCSDQVSMRYADLRGATFRADTNFSSIDLRNARLDGVKLLDKRGEVIPGACLRQDGTIVYSEVLDVPKIARDHSRIPGIS